VKNVLRHLSERGLGLIVCGAGGLGTATMMDTKPDGGACGGLQSSTSDVKKQSSSSLTVDKPGMTGASSSSSSPVPITRKGSAHDILLPLATITASKSDSTSPDTKMMTEENTTTASATTNATTSLEMTE